MRSRSNRLFVVLLHLVGVSTNLPHSQNKKIPGIVGVNPSPIVLERLDLLAYQDGLDGVLREEEINQRNYKRKRQRQQTQKQQSDASSSLSPSTNDEDYDNDHDNNDVYQDENMLLAEPYWFQDDVDGKCFGPEGFSECGDATLWLLRRRRQRQPRKYSIFSFWKKQHPTKQQQQRQHSTTRRTSLSEQDDIIDDSDDDDDIDIHVKWEYALQLVDSEMMTTPISPSPRNSKSRKQEDCLVGLPPKKQRRQDPSNLQLGKCSSLESAWSWKINSHGILYQDQPYYDSSSSSHLQEKTSHNTRRQDQQYYYCTWRTNDTEALLAPCYLDDLSSADHDESQQQDNNRLVSFSLVRYQATASTSITEKSKKQYQRSLSKHSKQQHPQQLRDNGNSGTTTATASGNALHGKPISSSTTMSTSENMPNHMDHSKAHTHASEPMLHPELKPPSQLLFARVGGSSSSSSSKNNANNKNKNAIHNRHGNNNKNSPLAFLAESNPLLFDVSSTSTKGDTPPKSKRRGISSATTSTTTTSSSSSSRDTTTTMRPRRIPVHPYIAACKNEVWTDPQTDLKYLTDLSGYLGDDRKVTGRHTLTGVGLYTRTVFNIKVYGVAMYVSKRDVLADPLFEQFSTLTSDELQQRSDFYSHLIHMPSPIDPKGGNFDRTILIKLNMQLSAETMRQSLQYDWKMLTDEHKSMLINCSLDPRPALEPMLRKIESEDNPGRCSCGQIAPEEYNADPSCCARGTDLGFTWRKSGNLEVRVDGRVMGEFPHPAMAKGIFFEYLRFDDPISAEARDNTADGFPFLLAPLAQVKGMSSRDLPNLSSTASPSSDDTSSPGLGRTVGNVADSVVSQAESFTKWVQSSANDVGSTVSSLTQSAGDSARRAGDEVERRRVHVWSQVVSVQENSVKFLSSRMQEAADNVKMRKDRNKGVVSSIVVPEERRQPGGPPRGRLFRSPVTRWLGDEEVIVVSLPDEIDPIISPTMNLTRSLFLCGVHLYLLLLLVVSLPGSYDTRTRLVVRKSCSSSTSGPTRLISKSADCDDTSGSEEERDDNNETIGTSPLTLKNSKRLISRGSSSDECNQNKRNMKKSLSYFL